MHARKASLFRNGRSQALRIPKEFELPGKEVTIHREGRRLVVEPAAREGLLEILARLERIDEDWPEIDDPLPDPVDL